MKKHIPNTITSLNLFSGCIASIMAFEGNYYWVVVWVIVAAIFDFFDGFAARLLKSYSPMGKELDSLADVVSFGFVPGITVFTFLSHNLYKISDTPLIADYLPYIGFLLTIFSALRLAKFNIDERQSDSFIGLNTPSNALFWVSFCYALTYDVPLVSTTLMYLFLVAILVFSILMVSEIPMFSLKVKNWKIRGNEQRYFLALFIVGLTIYIGILGIASGILLYITMSIINAQTKNN